VAAVKKSEL